MPEGMSHIPQDYHFDKPEPTARLNTANEVDRQNAEKAAEAEIKRFNDIDDAISSELSSSPDNKKEITLDIRDLREKSPEPGPRMDRGTKPSSSSKRVA